MPAPLASWNDTPTREAIVAFAERAGDRLPGEERVAVFDNDGTLWCEIELRRAEVRAPALDVLRRAGVAGRVRIDATLDEAVR